MLGIYLKMVSKMIWNKENEEYKLASVNKDDIRNAEQLLTVRLTCDFSINNNQIYKVH